MAEIFAAETSEHLSAVRELFEQYACSLGFDLGFQDFAVEVENLPGDYAAPDGCILLARHSGRIVGCVALRKWDNRICEMKRLFVTPEERGHGVGRLLAEAVIAHARQTGYESMRLDTLAPMQAANGLYASLGFQPIAPYRYNPIEGARFYELVLS
jgi:GNAT superfamily N-acetyltransferase